MHRALFVGIVAALLAVLPWSASAQCELVMGEDVVLGFGTAVRMAVDPVTDEPVILFDDLDDGLVYRHFYGPEWGRKVKVDTQGIDLPVGSDGVRHHAVDLVLDRYGRPRVAIVDEAGVYHTRYTSGWSDIETLLELSLGDPDLSSIHVRFERDPDDRAHVLFWTSVYDGAGRRSYHVFDGGTGFGEATHFDGAWVPRGATDSQGNFHVIIFDAFADPENPSGLHQYQAYYWKWTLEGGWPADYEMVTDEPNPPTGNGAGPVGSWPEIAVDSLDNLHVAYPMHATEDAEDGEVHYVTNTGSDWSEPTNLFPTNGHGGKPCVAVDKRGTVLIASLVYDKYYAVDFGHGFEGYAEWNSSGSHWQFHDLVQTCGLFWHVWVPVYWANGEDADITLQTFTKSGTCPDVPGNDLDDDGAEDSVDLCPGVPDPAQWDTDGDGTGDGCDTDDDGDGVPDSEDVCPRLADPDQADSNDDGLGDACSNLVDEDLDGWLEPYECDDTEPNAFPGNPEDCNDGIDNDCDGAVDGDDPDCPPGGDDDDDDDDATGDDDDGGGGGGPSDDDDGSWESGCECRSGGERDVGVGLLLVLLCAGNLRRRVRDRRPG